MVAVIAELIKHEVGLQSLAMNFAILVIYDREERSLWTRLCVTEGILHGL